MEQLRSRGWHATEEDERTVAQLLCDQLEFANVIIMNKMDLLAEADRARLRAVLRRFNPEAYVRACAGPGWVAPRCFCRLFSVVASPFSGCE